MKRSELLFGLMRIPLDALGVLAALLLSYRLRAANIDLIPNIQLLEPSPTLPMLDEYINSFVLPGMMVFLLLAGALRLYALRSTRSAWEEVGRVIIASLLWVVCVMTWYFLIRKQLFYSRILLIHSAFFICLFVVLARAAVVLFQRAMLRHGLGVRLVVSIGQQPIARTARDTLNRELHYHYLGHLPNLTALRELMGTCKPDLVVQTDPNPRSRETVRLIDECRAHHMGYAFLPPVLSDVPHLLEVDRLGMVPMVRLQPTPLDGWGRIDKRFFDIIVSCVMLVVLSPVLLIIALLILITSGWPIFYVSRRIGEHGTAEIAMLKFRTMVQGADRMKAKLVTLNERGDGPLFKIRRDPRITPLGRWLRRFDLDELPQLFNVLLGQMSLVGPRPHLPEEVSRYKPYERRVFAVKPGITGLAQVSGRSDLSFQEEVRLDLQYIEEWSLSLDLWILWRTAFAVLARAGEG